MELGSTHEVTAEVAKSGVLLALEHNMLPKSILQEALRWGALLQQVAVWWWIWLSLPQSAHNFPSHCPRVVYRPILTDLAFYNRIHLRLLRHLHRLLVGL